MVERYPGHRNGKRNGVSVVLAVFGGSVSGALIGVVPVHDPWRQRCGHLERTTNMGYGIGGILLTILVILAIIYFAKRV
jgi:tetrahydromethanopterin S-methyltransferase subunit E